MTEPIPYDDSIASVTIEVRRRDGTAFAYDLDGDHVRITVQGGLPRNDGDEVALFPDERRYLPPQVVEFQIIGRRRMSSTGGLVTVRQLDSEEQT